MAEERRGNSGNRRFLLISFGVIGLVFLVVFIPFCNSFWKSFFEYRDKTKYYVVVAELRNWSIAFEKYRDQHKEYPTSHSIDELKRILTPHLSDNASLSTKDPWEKEFLIEASKDRFTITCIGDDGRGDHGYDGAIEEIDYSYSTTIINGEYVQYLKFREDLVKKFEVEIRNIRSN